MTANLSAVTTAKEVRLSASQFRAGVRFPHLRFVNARPRNGKIVTAEGGMIFKDIPLVNGERAVNLCETENGLYVYTTSSFSYFMMYEGTDLRLIERGITKMIPYNAPDGRTYCYLFTTLYASAFDGLVKYSNEAIETGNKCGTVHNDRIFSAGDYLLRYSDIEEIKQPFNESLHGAGELELAKDDLGIAQDLFSWKDRIYLFREHGICVIRAYNDPLNYKITRLPVSYSGFHTFSGAICGEYIYFVAAGGLFSFNGGLVRPVSEPSFEQVDLSQQIRGYGYDGRYFARVVRKDGVSCLYCYDPKEEAGYFFAEGADAVFADDELLFIIGDKVYFATERGYCMGIDGASSSISTGSFALSESGRDAFVESVKIEGRGSFTVTLEAETGAKVSFSCEAGVRKVPPVPIRGKKLSVTMGWTDEQAEIEGMTLGLREVTK